MRLLLLGLVFCISACAQTIENNKDLKMPYKQEIQHIEKVIKKQMAKNNIVGMSVGLVDGQELVWAKGFGYADRSNKLKARPETIYRVGSITKLFNATAIMQMVEQGGMNLDAPLKTYLPEFSMRSRFDQSDDAVTLRNILSHHSGVISDWPRGMWGETVAPFTQLVEELKNQHLTFPPEKLFSYSNVGITLSGHALQNQANINYVDYIHANILQPLNMHDSYIAKNIKSNHLNAKGYIHKKSIKTPALRDLPAGGLNSSVNDLAKFAMMVMGNGQYKQQKIVQADTLEAMLMPQNVNNAYDENAYTGLGWMLADIEHFQSDKVAWHTGGTFSFFSDLRLSKKHKLAVIVLSNSQESSGIVTQISRELFLSVLKTKTGLGADKTVKTRKVAFSEADLEVLPGTYSTAFGVAELIRKKNKLKVEFGGKKLNIIKKTDGNFYLQYKLLGLLPISLGQLDKVAISRKEISDQQVLFVQEDDVKFLFAEKIPAQKISKAWRARLGHYQLINGKDSDFVNVRGVYLYEKDGRLFVESETTISVSGEKTEKSTDLLITIDDSTAYVAGLGRNKGVVLEVINQSGKEKISAYGYEFEIQKSK